MKVKKVACKLCGIKSKPCGLYSDICWRCFEFVTNLSADGKKILLEFLTVKH